MFSNPATLLQGKNIGKKVEHLQGYTKKTQVAIVRGIYVVEEERKWSGHETSVLYVGQHGDDSTLIVNRARTETECSFFVLNVQ